MIIPEKNKDILNLLIYKWLCLIKLSAVEEVEDSQREIVQAIGALWQKNEVINNLKPQKQIQIMQQKIMEILPEAKNFIIEYEPPGKLHPNDFMELYINHHIMCLERIKNLTIKSGV